MALIESDESTRNTFWSCKLNKCFVRYSGKSSSGMRYSKTVANPSWIQMSLHHSQVTALPKNWWASSETWLKYAMSSYSSFLPISCAVARMLSMISRWWDSLSTNKYCSLQAKCSVSMNMNKFLINFPTCKLSSPSSPCHLEEEKLTDMSEVWIYFVIERALVKYNFHLWWHNQELLLKPQLFAWWSFALWSRLKNSFVRT